MYFKYRVNEGQWLMRENFIISFAQTWTDVLWNEQCKLGVIFNFVGIFVHSYIIFFGMYSVKMKLVSRKIVHTILKISILSKV